MPIAPIENKALTLSAPIMFGYFPIGLAFGVYAVANGLEWYWPLLIGLIQYSGAAQFMLVALFAQQTAAWLIISTLAVLNLRHIFYGLPFLDALPPKRVQRLMAIFWLTDEVYAAMTSCPKEQRPALHLVGFWAYASWNAGCLMGGLLGDNLSLLKESLSFSLAALFMVLLIEQFRTQRTMLPMGIAVLIWIASHTLAGHLSIGSQLLMTMPGVIIALTSIHWAKQALRQWKQTHDKC